jgi:hypothetical protein
MRSESLRVEWMTPLNKTLKRALKIKGEDYVVTLSPEFLKISRKGHRLGLELSWELESGPFRVLTIAVNFPSGARSRQLLVLQSNSRLDAGPLVFMLHMLSFVGTLPVMCSNLIVIELEFSFEYPCNNKQTQRQAQRRTARVRQHWPRALPRPILGLAPGD